MAVTINVGGHEETLKDEYVARFGDAFRTAAASMEDALSIFSDPHFHEKTGPWKKDAHDDGIEIHYKDTEKGRYFAGRTLIPLSAKEQTDVFWEDLENYEWNDNIKFAKKLAIFSKTADIAHYASNDVLMVSSREFIAARLLRKVEDAYILSARSIKLSDQPELKGAVRAYLHLGAGICRPNPEDPDNSCIYDYIVCMDLKGMLVKSVINSFMGRMILKDVAAVRKNSENIRKQKCA